MSDLISRQAAVEIVDRYNKSHMILKGKPMLGAASIVIELEELPSAQPEIIRCGECKHCYIDGENVRFNVCELNHNKAQSDDWFCADAERRTDDRSD